MDYLKREDVPLMDIRPVILLLVANGCTHSRAYLKTSEPSATREDHDGYTCHANIDKSRMLASADYVSSRGERYCSQSSHMRPNLMIAYFAYVRMRTNRVVTVSTIDTVNTASQACEYGSKILGEIPGGGGRPRKFGERLLVPVGRP